MALNSVKGRQQWLNTILETNYCGEVFFAETTELLNYVKNHENSFTGTDILDSITSFLEGKFIKAMTRGPIAGEFFSLLKKEYQKAMDRLAEEKTCVPQFQWLQIISTVFYAWLNETPALSTDVSQETTSISPREEREMYILIVALSCLSAFTQVNYAGIPLSHLDDNDDNLASSIFYDLLSNTTSKSDLTLQLSSLKLNGEDVYSCTHFPILLIIGRALIAGGVGNQYVDHSDDIIRGVMSRVAYSDISSDETSVSHIYSINTLNISYFSLPIVQAWSYRSLSLHQDVLLDNTASIRSELHMLMNQLGVAYGVKTLLNNNNHHTYNTAQDDLVTNDNRVLTIGASPFDPNNMSVDNKDISLDDSYQHIIFSPTHNSLATDNDNIFTRSLRACVCLEVVKLCRSYWQNRRAEYLLLSVGLLANIQTMLTGVMGKRTRYQLTSHAQLMMIGATDTSMITFNSNNLNNKANEGISTGAIKPEETSFYDCVHDKTDPNDLSFSDYKLNSPSKTIDLFKMNVVPDIPLDTVDDVYLSTPSLDTDPAIHLTQHSNNSDSHIKGHHMSWLGMLATLSHAAHVRSNNATSDLTNNEELAYVNACLLQYYRLVRADEININGESTEATQLFPKKSVENINELLLSLMPWGGHTHALHLRSRLELVDHRRQIRSLTQLETIGNVFKHDQLSVIQPFDSKTGLALTQASVDTINAETQEESDAMIAKLTSTEIEDMSLSMDDRRSLLARWRMSGLFTSSCPSWWHHKRIYAELCVQAKLRQTALDAFLEIGLWENIIDSLIELGRKNQAETLIRSRLPNNGWLQSVDGENTPKPIQFIKKDDGEHSVGGLAGVDVTEAEEGTLTHTIIDKEDELLGKFGQLTSITGKSTVSKGYDLPEYKLWALLGDIHTHPGYYEKSWETSNASYPKAKRALGRYYFVKKDFATAYNHLLDAVEINSAVPEVWFTCGVCALEIRHYREAIEAFSRAVSIMPDYSEAWNNLAACHLHLNNKRAAFGALENAVHLRRDSWKMWENYLNCAIDLDEYQKAANALNRLCDLRGTTDGGTLLPIQYSGSQAQLHMFAAGVLTNAAVDDALKAFRKNLNQKKKQEEFLKTKSPLTENIPGSALSNTNIPENTMIMEQSFLSFQAINVLTKMEGIAGSMIAHESNMGGRRRGGGEEAGAANSITAEYDLMERIQKERDRRQEEKDRLREEALLNGEELESDEDNEEDDYYTTDPNDIFCDLNIPSRPEPKKLYETRMVAANNDLIYSLGMRYSVFIYDCLARVYTALQQYTTAAVMREKQIGMMTRDTTYGWAKKADVIAEVEDLAIESVRLYNLAADIDKLTSQEDRNGEMSAQECYTAARFHVDRVISTLNQANNLVNESFIPPTQERLQKIHDKLKSQCLAQPTQEASTTRDAYDAYMDDDMSFW